MVPVQQTEVVDIQLASTRMSFDNSISGTVVVRVKGDSTDAASRTVTYEVEAQQIGSEDDCNSIRVSQNK